MPPTKRKRKQTDVESGEETHLRPDQKRCRKCHMPVMRELQRCPFCGNAPWTWHPNARLLIVTLLICLFLFVLFPILANREKTYRVPVTEEEASP